LPLRSNGRKMLHNKSITLMIPARNEAQSLPVVLRHVPEFIDRVIVIDNGSMDGTKDVAKRNGAAVISEPVAGYGRACLAALSAVRCDPPDIVFFADADGSDDLLLARKLITPLVDNRADFTLAARTAPEKGALSTPQKIGNQLSVFLIRLFWKFSYADLGPMRAITWNALKKLHMDDPDYGWTVEMQIRAVKAGLRIKEFPTVYRKRIAGKSKVSRTFTGVMGAGIKIIRVIFREALAGYGVLNHP
jgi:glycosyltransferase involved in cell wall biosynthesis